MIAKRAIVFLFVCLLAAASVVPRENFRLEGDINGDQRVDILDLQLLALKMSADAGGEFPTGTVSVRDLQRTFNHAGLPESEQPSSTASITEFCQGVILSHQTSPPALQFLQLGLEPLLETPEDVSPVQEEPVGAVIPSRTLRYIFQLTPNAPPVFA